MQIEDLVHGDLPASWKSTMTSSLPAPPYIAKMFWIWRTFAGINCSASLRLPTLVVTDGSALLVWKPERVSWMALLSVTVEHSLHVARAHRRRGVGPFLLEKLCHEAMQLGKHLIIGGVDAGNTASLNMHRTYGFETVARFKEVRTLARSCSASEKAFPFRWPEPRH